jgi:hypothetical protein
MEKTVFEDLMNGGLQSLLGQRFGIREGLGRDIFQFRPLNILHDEDMFGTVFLIDLGYMNF